MDFILFELKNQSNYHNTQDLLHIVLNLLLDSEAADQLPRIVTPDLIKTLLEYINNLDNVERS